MEIKTQSSAHTPHSRAQGPLSCTQVAPSWSLLQCTVTFPSRASPACSVGLWLALTPHSAVGPGDPACARCCGGHFREGVLGSLGVAVAETASHFPASPRGLRLQAECCPACTPPLDPSFPCTPQTVMLQPPRQQALLTFFFPLLLCRADLIGAYQRH